MDFIIRSHNFNGHWLSKDHIYRESAHECLAILISDIEAIKNAWPDSSLGSLTNAKEKYPKIYELAKVRDRNNDMALLYSAMAIEGFINFYGVLRLGEAVFEKYIRNHPLERKLQLILLIADGLDVNGTHELIVHLKAVAKRRNNLVHPKAIELDKDDESVVYGEPIPNAAKESVESMEKFFEEFSRLIPRAAHHVKTLGNCR